MAQIVDEYAAFNEFQRIASGQSTGESYESDIDFEDLDVAQLAALTAPKPRTDPPPSSLARPEPPPSEDEQWEDVPADFESMVRTLNAIVELERRDQ